MEHCACELVGALSGRAARPAPSALLSNKVQAGLFSYVLGWIFFGSGRTDLFDIQMGRQILDMDFCEGSEMFSNSEKAQFLHVEEDG